MEINCKACYKPFNLKPSRISPDGNYCSKACWYSSGSPRPNRMNGIYKTCEVCEKEFYVPASQKDRVKHCSRKCKGIASRLPKKICPVCGKEWQPHYGIADQPCCSRECGYIYRQHGQMKPCEQCGKEFYVTNGRIDIARFCCKECADEWAGRNKTTHICKICGKEFRWSPSRSKAYNITYCSIPCRDADPERNEMLIAMNAKQQRMTPNHVETIGYNLLTELGWEFLPQHLIGNKFCVDAFVPSLNTVIQFDGDYWHFNPAKFKEPDSRQQKRVKLDQSQDAYMAACGYTVIRIWASDLEKHLDHVKTRLQSLLVPVPHMPVAQE